MTKEEFHKEARKDRCTHLFMAAAAAVLYASNPFDWLLFMAGVFVGMWFCEACKLRLNWAKEDLLNTYREQYKP